MTPEAQRIAIAKACGRVGPFENRSEWFEDGDADGFVEVLRDHNSRQVPDYLNDRNAIHDALAALFKSKSGWYERFFALTLAEAVNADPYSPVGSRDGADVICATPAQLAEAFLRVTEKWDDTK